MACKILNNFGIPFDYIDDTSKVLQVSQETGLKELPIFEYFGEFFSGQGAIRKIASLKPLTPVTTPDTTLNASSEPLKV